MLRITVATQAELLEGLAAGREDDDSVDFWGCIDASDAGRRQALIVLNEYIMRKTKEERERGAMRRATLSREATLVQVDQAQPAAQSPQVTQRNTMPILHRLQSEPKQDTSKSRRFPFLRSSTATAEDRAVHTTHHVPPPAQFDDSSLSPLRARTLSGSTQVSNSSRRTNSVQTPSSQRQSSTSINSFLQLSPSSNLTSGSTSPRSASMVDSPIGSNVITSYGGCCKYAHYLRDGKTNKALGRQNLALSPGATNFNFRCQSTKCAFQVPAYQNKKRDWIIDNRPRTWRRQMQYTPIFLAKSHVPTLVPLVEQKINAQYRCIICILSHERTNVFRGHDALLEHILGHGGAVLNGVRLEGPLSFSNDGVNISAEFDINLPEIKPTAITASSPPKQIGDAAGDVELQHELEKLEMNSKRSSHVSQETDPFFCPWD